MQASSSPINICSSNCTISKCSDSCNVNNDLLTSDEPFDDQIRLREKIDKGATRSRLYFSIFQDERASQWHPKSAKDGGHGEPLESIHQLFFNSRRKDWHGRRQIDLTLSLWNSSSSSIFRTLWKLLGGDWLRNRALPIVYPLRFLRVESGFAVI